MEPNRRNNLHIGDYMPEHSEAPEQAELENFVEQLLKKEGD